MVSSLEEAARRAEHIGARFSVLLLPWGAPNEDTELLARLVGMRVIDANGRAWADNLMTSTNLFPDGHYRPRLAGLVGHMVAEEICAVDFHDGARP
jgi:hypothetical protein